MQTLIEVKSGNHSIRLEGLAAEVYQILDQNPSPFLLDVATLKLGKCKPLVKTQPRASIRTDGNGGLVVCTGDEYGQQQFFVQAAIKGQEGSHFSLVAEAHNSLLAELMRRRIKIVGNGRR